MARNRICPLCSREEGKQLSSRDFLVIAGNNSSNDQERFVCRDCSRWTKKEKPRSSKGAGIKNQLEVRLVLSRFRAYGTGMTSEAIPGFIKATFKGVACWEENGIIRVIFPWTSKLAGYRENLATLQNIGDIIEVVSSERMQPGDILIGKCLNYPGVSQTGKQDVSITFPTEGIDMESIANLVMGFHELFRMDVRHPGLKRRIGGREYSDCKYREGNPDTQWKKMFATSSGVASIRKILERGTKTSQYHDDL